MYKPSSIGKKNTQIPEQYSFAHLNSIPKVEKRFALIGVGKEEQKVLKAFGIPEMKVPMVV